MELKTAVREPGDGLPGSYIRQLRKSAGLTQDEFARRIGLKGGKSTISNWENGRTECEGPAAELILLLFGGKPGDVFVQALRERARTVWERDDHPVQQWRQIVRYSGSGPVPLEPFFELFPKAAIPTEESIHGFPFYEIYGEKCVGFEQDMWRSVVPSKGGNPSYLWFFDRRKQFLYREHQWEVKPMSVTKGHLQFGEMVSLAQRTTFFLKRVYERLQTTSEEITLILEAGGMEDRGIGYYSDIRFIPYSDPIFVPPEKVWSQDTIVGKLTTTTEAIVEDPKQVGLSLAAEFIGQWDPRMTKQAFLDDVLEKQLILDLGSSIRRLKFLHHTVDSAKRESIPSPFEAHSY